jgi:hypothetical protein
MPRQSLARWLCDTFPAMGDENAISLLSGHEEPVALVGFHGFSVEKIRKNHDYWASLRTRASLRSLQDKKSPCRRFFRVLCAKRNKLLAGCSD